MKIFKDKKIIITGATGGIGRELCKLMVLEGAKLIIISSSEEKLKDLALEIGGCVKYFVADFSNINGIKDVSAIISEIDDVDYLINLAGILYFGSLGLQNFQDIVKQYNINILTPILLTRAVLPEMVKNNRGHIINIGSIFGSINFPFFATYSSSKAALRAFSESMRRELSQSNIKISYFALRAVKTEINNNEIVEFNKRTGSCVDDPIEVSKRIMKYIIQERKCVYFGYFESKFVKINYLFPSLMDKFLKKHSLIAQEILTKNNI